MKVYLAGGMKNNWRGIVKYRLPDVVFLDPCRHELQVAEQYTIWDLAAVRECDAVLAYMEVDNPSGIGLALEVGYARALGKVIVCVDGKPEDKYLGMVRCAADIVVGTLDEAVKFIDRLALCYV